MISTVKRWGNSYAIRLTKADLRRLHVREGQKVEVFVEASRASRVDLSGMPSFGEPGGMEFGQARADYYEHLPEKWKR